MKLPPGTDAALRGVRTSLAVPAGSSPWHNATPYPGSRRSKVLTVRRCGALLAVLALSSLVACAEPNGGKPAETAVGSPSPKEAVVATVGQHSITAAQLRAEIQRSGRHLASPAERKAAALENLVRHATLVEAAQAAGFAGDPVALAAYHEAMVERFLAQTLQRQQEDLAVSEEEVARTYQEQADRFTRPRNVRAAVLRVTLPRNASPAKRDELAERAAQARREALALPASEAAFGKVAVQYSDDQATRYRGGEIGWVGDGAGDYPWPDAVVRAIFGVQDHGTVSPVITADDGFYLVKVIDARPETLRPLGEVREQIRHSVLAQKRASLEQAFLATQRAKAQVEIHEDELAKVEAENQVLGAQTPQSLPAR